MDRLAEIGVALNDNKEHHAFILGFTRYPTRGKLEKAAESADIQLLCSQVVIQLYAIIKSNQVTPAMMMILRAYKSDIVMACEYAIALILRTYCESIASEAGRRLLIPLGVIRSYGEDSRVDVEVGNAKEFNGRPLYKASPVTSKMAWTDE